MSMIYETRVYRCLPGRLPALLKRFETITLKLWEKHGIKQAGFFTTLSAGLGIAGRAREEMGRVPERSGLDFRARENRGRRPDRRQHRQSALGPDLVLVGEVTGI
jgi:hypothetical protein